MVGGSAWTFAVLGGVLIPSPFRVAGGRVVGRKILLGLLSSHALDASVFEQPLDRIFEEVGGLSDHWSKRFHCLPWILFNLAVELLAKGVDLLAGSRGRFLALLGLGFPDGGLGVRCLKSLQDSRSSFLPGHKGDLLNQLFDTLFNELLNIHRARLPAR